MDIDDMREQYDAGTEFKDDKGNLWELRDVPTDGPLFYVHIDGPQDGYSVQLEVEEFNEMELEEQ